MRHEVALVDGLSQREHEAIEALLTAPTIYEACRRSGIPKRTLYRWLEKPHFRLAIEREARLVAKQGFRRLVGSVDELAGTIVRLAGYGQADHVGANIELAAATKGLELVLKVARLGEIEDRIAWLEAATTDDDLEDPEDDPLTHGALGSVRDSRHLAARVIEDPEPPDMPED